MRLSHAVFACLALPLAVYAVASCGGSKSSGDDSSEPTTNDGGPGPSDNDATVMPSADGGMPSADGGAVKDCFSLTDSKNLKIEFVQDFVPPPLADADYVQTSLTYPATYYSTTEIGSIADAAPPGATKLKRGYSLAANRCVNITGTTSATGCANTEITRGNSYSNPATSGGEPLLSAFSSIARADACTLLQIEKVIGTADATLQTAATAAGITLFEDADHTKLMTAPQKKTVMVGKASLTYLVDLCVLETESEAADTDGVFLTFAPEDLRKGTDVTAFLQKVDGVVTAAKKELIVSSLDLTSAGARGSGIDSADVHAQIDAVQGFSTDVGTGAAPADPAADAAAVPAQQTAQADYAAELNVLTLDGSAPLTAAEKKKVLLKVNLLEGNGAVLKLDEAAALNGYVTTEGYRGFIVFRNGIALGGACNASDNHNQVIACLAFGYCDGGFSE